MGDRANVIFNTKKLVTDTTAHALEGSIVLYSHCGGHELAVDVRDALERAKRRFDDEGYATRIVISQIVGNEWNDETGFGLYVGEFGDNEHNVLVVDWRARMVRVYNMKKELRRLDFANYMALADDAVRAFYLD